MELLISKGTELDIADAFELIKELALFEKAPNEVTNSIEQMKIDGFGKNPSFEFFVAKTDNKTIGLALYYTRYSTWKGRCLYLEDIIVTENFRRKNVGKHLFDQVLEHAKSNNFASVNWQVLNWNKSAIDFYKKYNAQFDDEWLNGKINLR